MGNKKKTSNFIDLFFPTMHFRKLQAIELGNDFSKVTRIVDGHYDDLASKLLPDHVIVKNHYVGINATDINFTNGKYTPGVKPPFDVGLEGLGEVVAVGSGIPKEKIGTFALYTYYGAFAEYIALPYNRVVPVPSAKPEFLGLLVSGLTASIALEHCGRIAKGETVLVTAAAGGAGQVAVQIAKQAGCCVIGTCSSDEKAEMLKQLGCDRPINYKKEDFATVLKQEFPKGVDVVFESIGGDFFDICLNNLAIRGRLIVIGAISSYATKDGAKGNTIDSFQLLSSSKTVTGFFMSNFADLFEKHMKKLITLLQKGSLVIQVDNGGFRGIDQVVNGVEYLHTGKSKGKVVVPLEAPPQPKF